MTPGFCYNMCIWTPKISSIPLTTVFFPSYVVVLLQTLVCFFRETDILSTRLTVIKDHK